MCITIATTFTVAWLPYQLTRVVMAYGNLQHALLIFDGVETLTYVNSCVNPIVYALMWKPFRQSLTKVRQRCFMTTNLFVHGILRSARMQNQLRVRENVRDHANCNKLCNDDERTEQLWVNCKLLHLMTLFYTPCLKKATQPIFSHNYNKHQSSSKLALTFIYTHYIYVSSIVFVFLYMFGGK